MDPINGHVTYSTPILSNRVFYGTIANFSCFTGFGLFGGEENLFCDGDGTSLIGEWDGNIPTCECKLSIIILNSCTVYVHLYIHRYMDVLLLKFMFRLQFKNNPFSVIQCEDLPNPVNGVISFSPDDTAPFDFGTIALYTCDTGFGLNGDDQRTCAGNSDSIVGEWIGVPPSCAGTIVLI